MMPLYIRDCIDKTTKADIEELEILELPKVFSSSKEFYSKMPEIINKYKSLITKYKDEEPLKKIINDTFLQELDTLHKGLLETLNYMSHHNENEAVKHFDEFMEGINFISKTDSIKEILGVEDDDSVWFRLRKGIYTHKKQIFHPPYKNHEVNKIMSRFGRFEFPCLFLSKTERGCHYENPVDGDYTIGKFQLNEGAEFNLLDLTCLNFYNKEYNINPDVKNEGEGDKKRQQTLHLIWPLIASCYVIIKAEEDRKDQYLISNYLSDYLGKKSHTIQGIRYYTC